MVSFFQYMAGNKRDDERLIFGIEEPENSPHPGLQRELFDSLAKIAEEGHQIIITSHSPVFAGSANMDSIALIVRNKGIAEAKQSSDFDASEIAEELGVEPADQITSYKACIFVEGKNDMDFFSEIASKMKANSRISEDFSDKDIGFIIHGGDNLKHFVDANALSRLSKRFGVVIDSDREDHSHNIPQRKLNWKSKCELSGGKFFILKKGRLKTIYTPKSFIENLEKMMVMMIFLI
ncbi:MAG: AAA family ATPase [Methanobacterium sp.]|nr:AAA family ATPase [Methanobacterium sp.]